MARNPHTSFRLSGECRELLALLAKFYGLTMTGVIEKLVRERVDEIGKPESKPIPSTINRKAANMGIFMPKPKSGRNPHGWCYELFCGPASLELKFSFSPSLAIYVDELGTEHELMNSTAGNWRVEL